MAERSSVEAPRAQRRPLDEPGEWRGVRVLGLDDLAELKLHAAVERGLVRDLCDLHLLCLAARISIALSRLAGSTRSWPSRR